MPRLTIATRFLIAVGIPSLVLMFFAGLEVRHAWLQSRAATVAEDGVALVREASALVHELQKERGASAGYLGSGGDADFRERVQGQRQQTDAAAERFAGRLAAYRVAGLEPVIEQAEEALAISAELEAKRDAVDELRIPLGDMAGWYTTQIGELINIAPTLRSAMTFSEGDALLAAMTALINAKERAGLERAMGANGFGKGAFAPDVYARFESLAVRQDVYLDEFRAVAPAESVAALDRLLASPVALEVQRMRQVASDGVRLGFMNGVTGGQWFDAITAKINLLRGLEAELAELLQSVAARSGDRARTGLLVVSVAVTLALLISSGLAYMSAIGLVRPLAAISAAFARIAEGRDLGIDDRTFDRKDEVGALARSAREMSYTADRAHRITSALDVSSGPIVVCNSRFYITYANPAFQKLVDASSEYFRSLGADVSDISGKNIDIFHKDKPRIRNMLEALDGQHRATIGFDERIFDLTAAPIIDSNNRRIGYAIVWDDVTQTRRLETQLREVLAAAGDGDFAKRLDSQVDDPFLRDVATGMNRICDIVATFSEDVDRAVRALAEGDLTRRVEGAYGGALGTLAEGVNVTVDRLNGLITDIKSAGGRVRAASDEIASGAGALAERAESQAAALEETAALMEEMTGSVKANADSASEARADANEADGRADSGRVVVDEAVSAMSRLSDSSRRMTEIVDVIASIATQTNLLALNAAVEAARAGDAGKGFAVVASEVGALARRSREAADDIRGLITESSERVDTGVGLVERTGNALSEMAEAMRRISERVGRIDMASREQASGVEEINQAVTQMDENTQRNAALADSSARSARALASESEELDRLTAMFRTHDAARREDGSRSAA
ncbi:methyl-accepting chemotaxis sensory transducer with Pas/Pac sensor [Albimonas donghaensis]|uniref:Methyl-accepting chemotaxis sensory transducer with Pas/Pac sensor n=1 Tax=Albimonas donghaensis TaxID=356660 RepID=A0A1H2SZL5_9RHOB|nr:nitrate- and nitrite sensing domain-containing protein [Albimonas donghaensis]SDW36479.1 methyl-accepting chemotaxis sensory transducer with Pas/Pac sensor [Albimonas donghaensis]